MHKSATNCNETLGKWCKNKHGASKIIDTLETYQVSQRNLIESYANVCGGINLMSLSSLMRHGIWFANLKKYGGLGIVDFQKQNVALLLKFYDMFYNNRDIPWVKLIWHAYYLDKVPHAENLGGSY
jgi:hypothetical protein